MHEDAYKEAVAWARSIVKRPEWKLFDTETTGLRKGEDEIVQICIANQSGEVELQTLIKPTVPIGEGAAAVHGITTERVQDAPAFPAVYPRIAELLNGQVVLAYNLDFDLPMLQGVIRKFELAPIKPAQSGCVMLQFAQVFGAWNEYHKSYRWQKLDQAATFYGLSWDGLAHDATADVKMAINVVWAMAYGS